MDKKARGLKYKRVLLKLSGEALLGQESYGVDPKVIARVSEEIAALAEIGVEIAIVVGGGNIFRGAGLAAGDSRAGGGGGSGGARAKPGCSG